MTLEQLHAGLCVLAFVVVSIAVALVADSWKKNRQERASTRCDVEREARRSALARNATGEVVVPFRAGSAAASRQSNRVEGRPAFPGSKADRSGIFVEQSKGAPRVASPSPRPLTVPARGQVDLLDLNAERRSTRIERRS